MVMREEAALRARTKREMRERRFEALSCLALVTLTRRLPPAVKSRPRSRPSKAQPMLTPCLRMLAATRRARAKSEATHTLLGEMTPPMACRPL